MGDLISREDTLTAFADYVGSGMSMNDYDALWDIVTKMPSVKQEPCEDAISRQSVIDSLHSKFADGFDSDRWWNSMSVLYAINKVPPVNPTKTGKWIPVSERLPEFRKEVLTCTDGGFIEIQSLEESYGGYWENQKGDWSDFDEIIAWMPLPTPYEPQERSGEE